MKKPVIVRSLSSRIEKIDMRMAYVRARFVTLLRYPGYPRELRERISHLRVDAGYFRSIFYRKITKDFPGLVHSVLEGYGYLSGHPVHYAKAQEAIADWSGFLRELEELLPLLRGGDKKIFRETISQLKQSIAVMASVRPERIR